MSENKKRWHETCAMKYIAQCTSLPMFYPRTHSAMRRTLALASARGGMHPKLH